MTYGSTSDVDEKLTWDKLTKENKPVSSGT